MSRFVYTPPRAHRLKPHTRSRFFHFATRWLHKHSRGTLYCCAIIIFSGAALWGIFFSGYFAIASVSFSGLVHISEQEIRTSAMAELAQPWFAILPQNALFIKKNALDTTLKKQFTRIDELSIERRLVEKILAVTIKEKETAFIWCRNYETPQEQCFFTDTKGIAFAPAPKTRGLLLLVFIDASENQTYLGQQVLTIQKSEFLMRMRNLFEEVLGAHVNLAQDEQGGGIRAKTHLGWSVILRDDTDIEPQIRILKGFLEKSLDAKEKSRLNRIDLRIPDRIYYTTK